MAELKRPDLPNTTDLRLVPLAWYIHRLMGQPAWVQGVVLPRRLAPLTVTLYGDAVEMRYLNPDGAARWEEALGNEVIRRLEFIKAGFWTAGIFVKPEVVSEADIPLIIELGRGREPYPQCITAAAERLRIAENERRLVEENKRREALLADAELARKVRRERMWQIAILAIVAVLLVAAISFVTAHDPNLIRP